MNSSICILESPQDLEKAYLVMHELRPHLSLFEFIDLYTEAKNHDGYKIAGIIKDGEIVAVMGYRILFDLVHGKHLYIDDLVTTKSCRSQGLGAQLLSFAEIEAKEQNCKWLRLCTGLDNEGGKKFYEKNNWSPRSLAYKKKI